MTQDLQLSRLLDAVRLVAGDLDLETVLRRIIEAACSLVDARYGALGVISDDGEGLSAFVHHGIDDETAAKIGPLPEGQGVLGHLINHPHPLRLSNVADHEASYGFPAHHPPMGSFLGAPIRIGQQVFGNLYLTEKNGAKEFSERDEELIVALAAVAGSVISNARLYEDLQRREIWRDAVLELAAGVLAGGATTQELQGRVSELAARMLDADTACVVVREVQGRDDRLIVLASWGMPALSLGTIDGTGSPVWRTLDEGDVVRTARGVVMDKPTIWVPVRDGSGIGAALGVARARAFSERDEQLLVGFGEQVSVAWTHEQTQDELRRLSLIEDRERIGRDLHDTVIQRLFATGLSLQAVIPRVSDRAEVTEKLTRAVDEIDTTVKDIRATIFALQSRQDQGVGLRGKVLDVLDEIGDALASTPRVRFDGPIDSMVPSEIADVAVPVIREALTNVAKHAQASQAIVEVSITSDNLVIRVMDNGIGIGAADRGGLGLHNLNDRAVALRGHFEVATRRDGPGTVLSWSVPLNHSGM